jgi:hypothetical protein
MSDKWVILSCLILLAVFVMLDSCYAKSGWYYGDTHTHTTYSDGKGSVKEMVQSAKDKGMDFIIITDHNTIKQRDDCEMENADDFMCLFGEEVTRGDGNGHGNAYFIDRLIQWFWGSNQQNIDRAIVQGGLFYINHPYLPDHPWTDWSVHSFNGIEVWNGISIGSEFNQKAFVKWEEYLNQGLKIYGIAGSDAHTLAAVGEPRICVYLGDFTSEALYEAMHNGHFYGTSGPDIRFEANGEMMGSTITVKQGDYIELLIRTWVDWLYFLDKTDVSQEEISLDSLQVCLIYGGDILKVWDVTSQLTEMKVTDIAEESGWYRVEVKDVTHPTIFAFSNPIWVEVEK